MAGPNDKTNSPSQNAALALLCPETLKAKFRETESTPIEAREGLKALLATRARPEGISKDRNDLNWEHCLELLVDDFLIRRSELLKLNKARKLQIETSIRRFSSTTSPLEDILQSRVGSQENEGLNLFAHEIAVFQFSQILLIKRWVDLHLLKEDFLECSKQTMNWKITSFLKKNGSRVFKRHDWSFLKQNCYSWFSPSSQTWERIRLILQPVNLASTGNHFLLEILHRLSSSSRLAVIGFSPTLIEPRHAWELLLEQVRLERGLDSSKEIQIGVDSPILISGLTNGDSLNSLQELLTERSLQSVWAFSNSDFQRFLTEINLLWANASDIPQLNLHPKILINEQNSSAPRGNLFADNVNVPYHAQFAACFPEGNGEELSDSIQFLTHLKEQGHLLLMSDTFWPTDAGESSQKLREATLKQARLQLIVDLRHVSGTNGEKLPKGLFLFEKNTSREQRDSNRPFILKLKGTLSPEKLSHVWTRLLNSLNQRQHPGEVIDLPLSSESIRLESLAAATSQQHLRSSPWQTLTESSFYEVSGQLKRNPQKAFASGTLLRMKNIKGASNFPRAVYIKDLPGKTLHASTRDGNFLFLPDQTVPEHPLFFVAQINSAPLQFWYHLECEQEAQRLSRGQQKQNEQLLKMMPIVRLFANGTLVPALKNGLPFSSLPDLEKRLRVVLSSSDKSELHFHSELHQIIVDLENTISQNLEVTREFSHHLYPTLEIERWNLPAKLPEASATQTLKILQHLDHTPLYHHPSLHVTRLKPSNDFKITNVVLHESSFGPVAELEIFSGIEPILKLAGPALFLKAAMIELQKRFGRSWQETAMKIQLPTDAALVNAQIGEILRMIQDQLKNTRACIELMDRIFCYLLHLSSNFEDDKALQMIRRHLAPDLAKINLDPSLKKIEIKPENFVIPKGILQ